MLYISSMAGSPISLFLGYHLPDDKSTELPGRHHQQRSTEALLQPVPYEYLSEQRGV